MKYFIDTEFHEGFHKPFLGKKRHFIDLISIGIVCEDGREYYAISKDFDLKAVWNAYDQDPHHTRNYKAKRVYWLRDNVLKPIYNELLEKEVKLIVKAGRIGTSYATPYKPVFCYETLKELIKRHGKSNKQITAEIMQFVWTDTWSEWVGPSDEFFERGKRFGWNTDTPIEFYGYYADYDWVLFCSLFGRMIDLPAGFPMYCRDLKQMLDTESERCLRDNFTNEWESDPIIKGDIVNKGIPAFKSIDEVLIRIKSNQNYPKQTNEHNALADAKWNFDLYKFLKKP